MAEVIVHGNYVLTEDEKDICTCCGCFVARVFHEKHDQKCGVEHV